MKKSLSQIVIDGRAIGAGHPCFVVAEIGVNHNGNVDTALAMVDAIAAAGADCVKFQTFSAEEFVNDPDETYSYVSQGKVVRESQLAMFKRLEINRSEFAGLFTRARENGLIPLSTPTDRAAVDLLDGLGAGAFKVGSDDLVYTPFLKYVAAKGKPVIISAGMADAEDIERAVDAIRGAGNDRICILHCVSLYPTPDDAVNLRKIPAMRERYGLPIGFSDHSQGITAAVGAVALGAAVVEKHFTLDRDMPGPDHRFSSDPAELAAMVSEIRRLEDVLGDPAIVPAVGELAMRPVARRSIVAARSLPAGHVIAADDLAYRRPGNGLMPYESDQVIGRRVRIAIAAKELIAFAKLESNGKPS
jgi:N-acetylneuraminate synthase/N,N'-diacetyllegionaminate synthase